MPQDQETAARSEWEARGGREVRRREGEAGEELGFAGNFGDLARQAGEEEGERTPERRVSAGWMKEIGRAHV